MAFNPNPERMLVGDGTLALPSLGFLSDPDNGFFRVSANRWAASLGGNNVLDFNYQLSVFTVISFSAAVVDLSASVAWTAQLPSAIIVNTSASAGARVDLREGTTNGSNGVQINAPANLAATYGLEFFDSQPASGSGIMFGSSGKMNSSPFANAMAITFELNGALSTSTDGGFQWSAGDGLKGDGAGAAIPFNFAIVAIGLSVATNTGGTATVQVWYGGDGDSTSTTTGVGVSLSSSERHNTNIPGSPVNGNAGDWILPKTTALSGTVENGRVTVWIRPR